MAIAPAYASYVNALATFETKITLVKTDNETFKQMFSEFIKEYRIDNKDTKLDIQKILIKQGILETKLEEKRGK